MVGIDTFIRDIAPKKVEEFLRKSNGQATTFENNYEQFMQLIKRLYNGLDSVRISNMYIRYSSNLLESRVSPFGNAVIQEFESDLLQEVILCNTAILDISLLQKWVYSHHLRPLLESYF